MDSDEQLLEEISDGIFVVDASSATDTVYLGFENDTVQVLSANDSWIIAIKRTMFQTNSGSSGSQNFGVQSTGEVDFLIVQTCGYSILSFDEELPVPGPPGAGTFSGNPVLNAWYNYDPVTHAVSSKQEVYLITDGASCIKMQILSYNAGVYQLAIASLIPEPSIIDPGETETEILAQSIDASSTESSVYLKLEGNSLISVGSEADWEIAVKRTMFQTNSGTSGEAGFGVFNTGLLEFSQVNECSYDSLSFDEELPIPGPPGSGTFSGNAALNSWYNYNPITHAVSSKQEVYVLSDGIKCFKFQIKSYASGIFQVLAAELD